MNLRLSTLLILLAAVIALEGRPTEAQTLYSYMDADGTRVFTNIAPVQPVRGLTITGAPAPSPPEASPASGIAYRYDTLIEKYASTYRLDPSLVRSVIATESGFNEKAVSSKGARGLMQLMPATASRLGVQDSFDPEQNIQAGTKHLRYLLDMFDNDLPKSLAAYNAGENLVQRLGRIPDIKETHDYVRLVTQRIQKEQISQQATQPEVFTPVFQFVDADGILNLTNIAPASGSSAN